MIEEQRGLTKKFLSVHKIRRFFIILIAVLGIALLLIFIFGKNIGQIAVLPTCGDGSFYDSCSLDKPYYCSGGNLLENSSTCGCPSSLIKSEDSCTSSYQSNPEFLELPYVLDGKNYTLNFTAYKGLSTYLSTLPKSIVYYDGQQPLHSDFKLMRINEPNQELLMMPLIKEIENLAPQDKVTQARIAISVVQNIPWGNSPNEIGFGSQDVADSRYPYQVLYDGNGLCSEKSELLAEILKEIGYGIAIFYYPAENHETLGIKCPVENSLGGSGYCFVETSGPAIISDSQIEYSGGIKLTSSPQIILISNGISLPSGLPEYNDAKTLARLRDKASLGPIDSYNFRQLENKYGLSKVYNIQ
ncbi:MAG TPA: hypothetical protein VMC07_00735 [Candidatus Omnitrophota bacterium]|nr:hypothetical protein [Candidatus Omnitrophota bacterium]